MSQRDTHIRTLSALKAQIKELEAQAATVQDAIIAELFDEGLTEYSIPGEVKAVVQNRKSPDVVSKELLIANGVDPDVVLASTKPGSVSAPFVRLYPVKVEG